MDNQVKGAELTQVERDELLKLREENAKLKQAQSSGLGMKVSKTGGVSVYGLGRFPVTLYRGQWEALFERIPAIKAFIEANTDKLTVKPQHEKIDEDAA